jgi:hypothetical protein
MSRPPSGKPWKKRTYKPRPAHGGGHLNGKKQTPAEFASAKQYFTDGKARWEYLFHPDRNKWTLIV